MNTENPKVWFVIGALAVGFLAGKWERPAEAPKPENTQRWVLAPTMIGGAFPVRMNTDTGEAHYFDFSCKRWIVMEPCPAVLTVQSVQNMANQLAPPAQQMNGAMPAPVISGTFETEKYLNTK